MTWRPDENDSSCEECRDIARAINAAFALAYFRNKPASDALRRLIGGTEDDAERADQVLVPYRFQPNLRRLSFPEGLQAALRRGSMHCARTGHIIRPFLPR